MSFSPSRPSRGEPVVAVQGPAVVHHHHYLPVHGAVPASTQLQAQRAGLSPPRQRPVSSNPAKCFCGRDLVKTQPGYTRQGIAGTLVGDWVCDRCGRTAPPTELRYVCLSGCDYDVCSPCRHTAPSAGPALGAHAQRSASQSPDLALALAHATATTTATSTATATQYVTQPVRVGRPEQPAPVRVERTSISPPPPISPSGSPRSSHTPPSGAEPGAVQRRSRTPPDAKPLLAHATMHAGPHEGNPCKHCFGKVFATDKDPEQKPLGRSSGSADTSASPPKRAAFDANEKRSVSPARPSARDFDNASVSSSGTERPSTSSHSPQRYGRVLPAYQAEAAAKDMADSFLLHKERTSRMWGDVQRWETEVPPQHQAQAVLSGDPKGSDDLLAAWLRHLLLQVTTAKALCREQLNIVRGARDLLGDRVQTAGSPELRSLYNQLCYHLVEPGETDASILEQQNRALQQEIRILREKLKEFDAAASKTR